MPSKYDPNTLWVALSEYGEGNIFHVYPKILADLLMQEDAARRDGDTSEAERLVLPSDKDWKMQQYYMLVELQKPHDDETEDVVKPAEEVEVWAPWTLVTVPKNSTAPPPVAVKTTPGPAWDIAKVLKAAGLLSKPPQQVDFSDEQEMRCVYSLIYDVFRYKTILDQALDEFFRQYPEFSIHRHITWLFLMELTRRQWGPRPRGENERAARMLQQAGSPLRDIESAIWGYRVHFAASFARIRIKNKAFSLSDLLPAHLKEERVSACVHKETITGWVNTFKAKKVAELVKRLHELGYSYSNSKLLCAGEYRFDRVCPRFITLRPPQDVKVGLMNLVKDGVIVLQEREFCEGASTLCRALQQKALQGAVAQSHASSPRCSAYLAAQLRELAALRSPGTRSVVTPELGKLIVFGAGDKVEKYVCALRDMGIEASEAPQFNAAVCVVSDPVYGDNPIVSKALDGVVAVLATPPNSYSAVTDPIDLVCGRGGDLSMLEVLTESEIDVKGKARVQSILEEQKKTLTSLMSKPQIQLILYETHSSLEAENEAQVTRAVSEANRLARERHALLHKKQRYLKIREAAVEADEQIHSQSDVTDSSPPDTPVSPPKPENETILKKPTDMNGSRPPTSKARPIPNVPESEVIPRNPDQDLSDVFVPGVDLFEILSLPRLGNGLDIDYILDRDGCYLGLIQRKEITRLDAKYMIQMAEERGLFGQAAPPPPDAKKKKGDHLNGSKRRRRKNNGFEVERVAAPTQASLRRARVGSAPASLAAPCATHLQRHAAAARAAAACACAARHRPKVDVGRPPAAAPPRSPRAAAPCRRLFPITIRELRLRSVESQLQQKIFEELNF